MPISVAGRQRKPSNGAPPSGTSNDSRPFSHENKQELDDFYTSLDKRVWAEK